MSSVTENGILEKRDFELFKNRTVESKFRYQLFLGIGGATVFGLVGAFGKALLDVAMAPAVAEAATFIGLTAGAWAWVGLAAIGAIGLGGIYMGSKFLSESILMDQDFQAKKIALAADSRAHALINGRNEPTKVNTTPPGMAIHQQEDKQDAKWTEKFAAKEQTEKWADEVQLSKTDETQRLH